MDTKQAAVTEPWADLEALVDFIDNLRADGYNIGVKEYLDVHQVLMTAAAAPSAGGTGAGASAGVGDQPPLSDPDQVRRLIGPILCSTAEEQNEFADRFRLWVERYGGRSDEKQRAASPSLEEELSEIARKDSMRWLPALLAFLVLILVVGAILAAVTRQYWGEPAPPLPTVATSIASAATRTPNTGTPRATLMPTAAPIPTGAATPPRRRQRPWEEMIAAPAFWLAVVLSGVLVAVGMYLARRLWYRYRANLFLERRSSEEPPDITRLRVAEAVPGIFNTPEMRGVIRRFRRRVPAPAKEVDVSRTLAKTIRHGGWLSPVYASRQQLPEYIALISRVSYSDHLAHMIDELLAALRSGNVYLSVYYFDATPQVCTTPSMRARSLTLRELAAQAAGQRLLLFGEAQVVLDPLSGEPAEWTRLLAEWPVHVLFTPSPPNDRGAAEQQAARILDVWPALPEGLDLFIRTVHGEAGEAYVADRRREAALPMELRTRPIRWLQMDPPPPAAVQQVLAGTRGYLGDWGYTWLCACAVYPEVRWNLTLFLGLAFAGVDNARSAYFQRTLLDLTRLPWFQYGVMPDWLRRRLISELTPDQEWQARVALQGLLLTALDNPAGGFQIEIAQTYQSAVRRLVKPLLGLLRRQAGPHSAYQDRVFLAFMGGRTSTRLALRLPEALRALWSGQTNQQVHAAPAVGSFAGWNKAGALAARRSARGVKETAKAACASGWLHLPSG